MLFHFIFQLCAILLAKMVAAQDQTYAHVNPAILEHVAKGVNAYLYDDMVLSKAIKLIL